jgi:hypothetical protein
MHVITVPDFASIIFLEVQYEGGIFTGWKMDRWV